MRAILDKLTHKDPDSSDKEGAQVQVQIESLEAMQKLLRTAQKLGIYGQSDVLQMPLLGDGL